MKTHPLQKLAFLAKAKSRTVIGCLSGTSMDGLDVMLSEVSGYGRDTHIRTQHAETVPFDPEMAAAIRNLAFKPVMNSTALSRLHSAFGRWIGNAVLGQLQKWGVQMADIDLIASHGQTVFHAPDGKGGEHGTLQIGDGDQISLVTGIPVVSDFRQKQVAAGGEGAPLATYADWLLFGNDAQNRVLLNIGGISNFTYLPANGGFYDIRFGDTGPGNTLMDAWAENHFGIACDKDGAIAKSGNVLPELLAALKNHPWFALPFPKTTGPELFNLEYVENRLKPIPSKNIAPEDVMATLCRFTAETIYDALKQETGGNPISVYVSGGGASNPKLMEYLSELLGKPVRDSSNLGIHPGFKEAALFSVLANELIGGDGFPRPDGKGLFNMGKLSLPV